MSRGLRALGAARRLPRGEVRTGFDEGGRPVLSVAGLSVRLSGHTILEDVSFELGGGELAGLIGANGAGKTTLLRTIAGLQAPSGGSVQIASTEAPRPPVGYVPQQFAFEEDLPLRSRDLVGLGLDGHRLGLPWPSRRRRAAVEEMLAAVGAEQLADARVGRLSGGQQQRVLIAHALIARPRLLLLDEPLSSLDLRAAHEVVTLLARLARERGIAVLLSAHELNPLLPAIDRVIYLAGGRAASGSVDEVVRSQVLSRLYGHHVDVLRVHGRVLVIAGTGHGEHPAGPPERGRPPVEIV
jgi:zinc/manganese transport system ATP-binding protein